VEKVLPELVTEDEQGYKAVRYNKLPFLMLEGIKELKEANDALRQDNQRLSGQVAALRTLVCQQHPSAEVCR
jgi:FtsZ-binding cell division protein ZapB